MEEKGLQAATDSEEIQTTVDGVRAVDMHLRNIREISSGDVVFFQSRTQLHTPGLGTLMPEAYRETAEATEQANELFELEVMQAIDISKRLMERDFFFRWVSVYMPLRVLVDSRIERKLLSLFESNEYPTGKITFALSGNILDEKSDDKRISENILKLRNRGFHFLLEGFGADNCPMMRLSSFEVDYCLLHHDVTRYIGQSTRADNAVNSIVGFVREMGAEAIADGIKDSSQAEKLYECGCSYVAGPLAGKYMNPSYIRKPKEKDEKVEGS